MALPSNSWLLSPRQAEYGNYSTITPAKELDLRDKSSVFCCMECNTRFNFVVKKHSCRTCGDVYCNTCCELQTVVKNSSSRNEDKRYQIRMCLSCISTYTQGDNAPYTLHIHTMLATQEKKWRNGPTLKVSEAAEVSAGQYDMEVVGNEENISPQMSSTRNSVNLVYKSPILEDDNNYQSSHSGDSGLMDTSSDGHDSPTVTVNDRGSNSSSNTKNYNNTQTPRLPPRRSLNSRSHPTLVSQFQDYTPPISFLQRLSPTPSHHTVPSIYGSNTGRQTIPSSSISPTNDSNSELPVNRQSLLKLYCKLNPDTSPTALGLCMTVTTPIVTNITPSNNDASSIDDSSMVCSPIESDTFTSNADIERVPTSICSDIEAEPVHEVCNVVNAQRTNMLESCKNNSFTSLHVEPAALVTPDIHKINIIRARFAIRKAIEQKRRNKNNALFLSGLSKLSNAAIQCKNVGYGFSSPERLKYSDSKVKMISPSKPLAKDVENMTDVIALVCIVLSFIMILVMLMTSSLNAAEEVLTTGVFDDAVVHIPLLSSKHDNYFSATTLEESLSSTRPPLQVKLLSVSTGMAKSTLGSYDEPIQSAISTYGETHVPISDKDTYTPSKYHPGVSTNTAPIVSPDVIMFLSFPLYIIKTVYNIIIWIIWLK